MGEARASAPSAVFLDPTLDDGRRRAYAVALAELPRSACAAQSRAEGAIVVLGNPGGSGELGEPGHPGGSGFAPSHPAGAGTKVLIIDEPERLDTRGCSGGVSPGEVCEHPSLVVARRHLARGMRSQLRALIERDELAARLVTVELGGATSPGLVRDALGWVRVLLGGVVVDAPADAVGGASLGVGVRGAPRATRSALAQTPDGAPVLVSLVPGVGPAWFRVSVFGAATLEIAVDDGLGRATFEYEAGGASEAGHRGFEGEERAVLRAALALAARPGGDAGACEWCEALEDLRVARSLALCSKI